MAFAGSERFELRRQLGRGGMGVVYEAYDHVRNMRVALKTLRRLDADGLLRFKREFRALSNLSHPNIIHLYELVSEGRDWFFTMEYIDGVDLVSYVRHQDPAPRLPRNTLGEATTLHAEQELEQEVQSRWTTLVRPTSTPAELPADANDGTQAMPPLPSAPAVAVAPELPERPALESLCDPTRLWGALSQLAGALCALHQADMVHCDLKPSNIMITREGRVVLMDFGVVAATRWSHDLVRLAEVEGTPAFMAPEQARGEPPSAAADWYAFGVTLYLLLAGRLPFDNDTMQVLLDKQEIDPLPPSIFTLGIPPALEALCMALLQREPAARPRGEEVLAALGVRREGVRRSSRVSVISVETDLFVGRARELAVLRDSYEAVRAGQMRYVLVDGPSGMGKTSLLGHFLQEIRAASTPPLVLMGRCRERESLAYKAFDGLVDQLSLYLQELPVRERRALLPEGAARLAQLFPVLRRVKELDVSIQVAGGLELRLQAVRTLRELLAALAREQPIVACIDDLQWADQDSFELLRGLLEPPAPAGLLLLLTVRSDSPHTRDTSILEQLLAGLDTGATGRSITLGPLSAAEQRALVARLDARGDLSTPLADALVQESAGHPMLLSELARHAGEDAGALVTAGALHLDDILWRRVSRLDPATRALVEVLAIAGEPMPLAVLAEAAGLSPADRERALSAARAGHLVRVTRTGPEPWLDTYHDKVREAVIVRLPAGQARMLHGHLARAMESWDQASTASLARHWLAAGEPDRAAEYLVSAAHEAVELLAFGHAAALYRTVVELLADLPSNPVRDRHLCQAWLGLARGMRLADRTDDALALLERAETVASAHQWNEELADIHFLRGNLLFLRYDLDGCLAQHTRARAYARQVDSPRREAAALGGLGDAHYMRGQFASAHDHFTRSIELCQRHGFADIEAANLPVRATIRYYFGNLEAGLRDGAAAVALAARIGHLRAELVAVTACQSRLWSELGWLHSVRPQLERARALARSMGSRRFEAGALAGLARLLGIHGHHDEAEAMVVEARALLRETARSFTNVMVLGAFAEVTRDRAAREQALAEAEAQVATGTLRSVSLWFHRDAMEIALAHGEHERVERHARILEDYTRDEPLPWVRFVVERARTLVAYRQGRCDYEIIAALERLFHEACRVGYHVAAEALGQALAEAGSIRDALK